MQSYQKGGFEVRVSELIEKLSRLPQSYEVYIEGSKDENLYILNSFETDDRNNVIVIKR
jgi:hypothetical protein